MERITYNSPLAKSEDIVDNNIEKLKQLFPDVFTEGKIDFNVLQELLGKNIETEKERYSFNWSGKAAARREALKPSAGTLRPCVEESKDWDKTKNLYIEGDNLEVLKLLQKSYHNKIKMIYIDPPYNTGKDFVYKDNFKDNLKNYLEQSGQTDNKLKFSTNTESSGRFHSNWLNMIYPRLSLARNLLIEDGVVFISIDETEQHNMKFSLNELFGEDNFICEFIWKNKHGGGGDSPYAVKEHEYIYCYCKDIQKLPELFSCPPPDYDKMFREKDERGPFYFDRLDKKGIDANRPNLIYPIECPDGTMKDISPAIWRLSEVEFFRRKSNNNIGFKKDKNGEWQVYTKTHLFDEKGNKRRVKTRSILKQEIVGFTQNGNKEITNIFNEKLFQNPKPVALINYLVDLICRNKDEIILDFFSGSCTTAHAVLELNKKDGGNRKFIMVQLPEPCNEKSEAKKAGYDTIADIGKERIRRVIKKIKEEETEKTEAKEAKLDFDDEGKEIKPMDLGFKVFKLDSSNTEAWELSADASVEEITQKTMDFVDYIKTDRTDYDVVYEVLLKYGIDLTRPIKEYTHEGKKVYSVSSGLLMLCLDDNIDTSLVNYISNIEFKVPASQVKIVFKDSGFIDSVVKTNAIQILKNKGIKDVKSI